MIWIARSLDSSQLQASLPERGMKIVSTRYKELIWTLGRQCRPCNSFLSCHVLGMAALTCPLPARGKRGNSHYVLLNPGCRKVQVHTHCQVLPFIHAPIHAFIHPFILHRYTHSVNVYCVLNIFRLRVNTINSQVNRTGQSLPHASECKSGNTY